jgi:hypothetical protein
MAGTEVGGNVPPAGGNVQGVHGHFVPHAFTKEELYGADPRLQLLNTTDRYLLGIFGDTIHLNDGTHLGSGIGVAEDAKWQWLYNHVASCSLPLYNLPNGQYAQCFLMMLTDLWDGVIQRHWNSAQPLVFQVVILHRVHGISQYHEVKPIVWGQLDAWDKGRYVALVKEVKEVNLDTSGGWRRVGVQHQDDATSLTRQYDVMVLSDKIHLAIQMLINSDLDSKSSHPVIDVLWE